MRRSIFALAAVAMLSLGIAGCGGDDGAPGAPGAPGTPGATGPTGPAGGSALNVGTMTAEQWAGLTIVGTVTKVTTASPTVVEFKLADTRGTPIVGIGKNVTTSSSGVKTYDNIRFTIAKLLEGANGSPDEWVNYIVLGTDGKTPGRPTAERNGTLVDKGDGSYTYTFAIDITKVKDVVAASGAAGVAALGDLTYDTSKQHRLVIQISGTNSGVSLENAANVVYDWVPASGATIAAADQKKAVIDTKACNACHQKLEMHGGGRPDARYCTTCHTAQRAYGRPDVASDANGAFPALTETFEVDSRGWKTYEYASAGQPASDPYIFVGDGEVLGHFTTMVHKIHNGSNLSKKNYNFENVVFDMKGFSMLDNGQRMCTVCHSSSAPKADLAYSKPSIKACGACHDNVNFKTGKNHGQAQLARPDDSTCTLCHDSAANKVAHRTVNLTPNNPAIDDGLVSFTYDVKEAKVDADNNVIIEFAIFKQTAPSTDKTPVTFADPTTSLVSVILSDGTTKSACLVDPLDGFSGAPSFLLAFAAPQNGGTPADYNNIGSVNTSNSATTINGAPLANAQPTSISIASLLNGYTGKCPSTSSSPATFDAPNPGFANGALAKSSNDGYYIATIKGAGLWAMPKTAAMRSVTLQGYFTQRLGAAGTTDDVARHTLSVVKSVTGDAVRRQVVDAAKCGSCHEWFEGHGGNRVIGKDTKGELVCVVCHVPGIASSGHTITDKDWKARNGAAVGSSSGWSQSQLDVFKEWGVSMTPADPALFTNTAMQANMPRTTNNLKDMIHGIHAGRQSADPFRDARNFRGNATLLDFRRMTFPGVISNCETCHKAGTYSAVPTGALETTHYYRSQALLDALASPVPVDTIAPATSAMVQPNLADTTTSPYAAACASCHKLPAAKAHMELNGAFVNQDRSMTVKATESCAVCHGSGAAYDVSAVHK